jgi:hypothetical protein
MESFGPFPALKWQIPEQITRMTGVAHNSVVQRKCLLALKVLEIAVQAGYLVAHAIRQALDVNN